MKADRPYLPPLTDERLQLMLDCNDELPVFRNADCVMVGDLVLMVEEIRKARKESA